MILEYVEMTGKLGNPNRPEVHQKILCQYHEEISPLQQIDHLVIKREMITIYDNDQTPTCGQTGPNEPSLDTTSLTSHLVLHCGRT